MEMASNGSTRKRQQRSKSGAQNKVSHTDNQRNREQLNQQKQNNPKNYQYHVKQNQTLQQHQRQQSCASKSQGEATLQINLNEPIAQNSLLKPVIGDNDLEEKSKTVFQDSRMALHSAIFSRRYDIVDELLKTNMSHCDTDPQGNTAFMSACRIGDIRLISTLSTAGLSINHSNRDGETALHLCAKSGHEDGCKFLLAHGTNTHAKTKSGDTPLHIAAQNDHVGICRVLLNSLLSSSNNPSNLYEYILDKNSEEQTPICLSVVHNHSEVTRIMLEFLPPQQQTIYLIGSLQKALSKCHSLGFSSSSSTQLCHEVFLHRLLVSMSVILIRLAERRKRHRQQADCTLLLNDESKLEQCLAKSDLIQMLVSIACAAHNNLQVQILTIACFLIVYLMEGLSEREALPTFDHVPLKRCVASNMLIDLNKTVKTGLKFTEQFIQCCGPDNLLLKLNNMEVEDSNQATIAIAIATPIMFLSGSPLGKTWLEKNKSHLTFLKELLIQNMSNFTLLTSTCPLLKLSLIESTCQDFVKLVEILEDRDREKNLADLLWEEERDRIRRERKKQKQNQKKKQTSKQLKNDVTTLQVQTSEVSSDNEVGAHCIESTLSNEDIDHESWKPTPELLTESSDISEEKHGALKACHISGIQLKNETISFPQNFMEINLRMGDKIIAFQEEQKSEITTEPQKPEIRLPLSIDESSLLEREKKSPANEVWSQDLICCDKFQVRDIDTVSKVMRWADVAKIGCSSNEQTSFLCQENTSNGFKPPNTENDVCDFQFPCGFKDTGTLRINKIDSLYKFPGQSVGDHPMMEENWNNEMDYCQDPNSDGESTTSSSSFGSRSSFVSDSMLHTRRPYAMTQITPLQDTQEENLTQETNVSDCKMFENEKTRRIITKTNSVNPCPKNRIGNSSADQAAIYSHQNIGHHKNNDKTKFKLPGVGGCLLRSRSEDILIDSNFASKEKCDVPTANKKSDQKSMQSRATKRNWKESVSLLKSETQAVLPPLRFPENNDTCRDETGDFINCIQENLADKQNKNENITKTDCSDKSYGSKSELLDNVNRVDLTKTANCMQNITPTLQIKEHTMSVSNSLASWSDLSKLVPTFTAAQQLYSGTVTKGQASNTKIRPSLFLQGCQNTDPQTASYVPCINNKPSVIKTPENGQTIPSTASKGRVFATILLDKVKNPPNYLQKNNKIPPLSSLAWNFGEESNQTWSRLFQHKTNPLLASESYPSPIRNVMSRVTRDSNLKPLYFNRSSDHSVFSNASEFNTSNEYNMMSSVETPAFSTILMNRMQQRRFNRNPLGILNVPDMKSCSKTIQIPDSRQQLSEKENSQQNKTYSRNLTGSNIAGEITSISQNQQSRNTNVNLQDDPGQFHWTNELGKRSNNPQGHLEIGFTFGRSNDEIDKTTQREILLSSDTDEKHRWQAEQSNEKHKWQTEQSTSPPVLFPEKIRDDVTTSLENGATFPAFHDIQTSDFLSEMFSDPLFSDKIAINQVRQKILFNHLNQNLQSDSSGKASVSNDIDLDYYASLYRMKFRDVLGHLPGQNQSWMRQIRDTKSNGVSKGKDSSGCQDGDMWYNNNQMFGIRKSIGKNVECQQHWQHISRWRSSLQKILDLPWTLRRQYEDIVLPHSVSEFSMGMAGNVFLSLGFLMNGTEVAVLLLDKSRERINPGIIELMNSSEMDKHFLARCKSSSESSDIQCVAINIFEYNLCEYLQMYIPGCSQTSNVLIGIVWQLFQALGFLHQGLGIAHGYLAPCWVFINLEGNVRLAGFGMNTGHISDSRHQNNNTVFQGCEYQNSCWVVNEEVSHERIKPCFSSDILTAGMLAYFILQKGQYQFGTNPIETETNLTRDRLGPEAVDLVYPMLITDPKARPTIDQCLKHPIFWTGDKKFRLILIVGSDVLTEMKTGVALTGIGAPTMMEILSMVDINIVSPNWIHEVDGTVLKEMKSFRVYKNNLAELTLFVYNCCLHFDKLSNVAKEILDDPCKYFQNLFPSLFMAIYRSLKASDRTDRTCYKPFFYK